MLPADLVAVACLAYVALLFTVAWLGDRKARRDPGGWLSSPLVYTLSISIYCTSWTFYGAVGSAARTGLEFATIYLGPTLVFIGWRLTLRKLVTVGRRHHVTSVADFLSARFGKDPLLGALATFVALVATAPYIALQLKALTASFQVITYPAGAVLASNSRLEPDYATGLWIAAGLCLFAIVFGVRNIDVNERHQGVIAAIAVEALVKLAALLAVGLWVVVDHPAAARLVPPALADPTATFGPRWPTLLFLAGAAVICLPRQFQVTVVENESERQLRTASWLFPLYLFLICLFVVPIAVAGLGGLPAGSDPDLFVLTLPLGAGKEEIALFAFLGGFSSATSMVIVSSIALSTMISNHVVMPLALRLSLVPTGTGASARRFIIAVRRASIVFTVALGFLYFRLGGRSDALAAIGLVSFCGVAQFLPGLAAGLLWRRAAPAGATAGLAAGFLVWLYALFLPSLGVDALMPTAVMDHGPFGLGWLRPHALFGIEGLDPLVHAVFWSMALNAGVLVAVSLVADQTPLQKLQSALFVDVFSRPGDGELRVIRRTARTADLRRLAHRILGPAEAIGLFAASGPKIEDASEALISRVEQRLSAHVGASSARTMVSRVVTDESIGVDELKRLAGETERIRAHSAELEEKSRQIEATVAELARANERLRRLDARKDDFLSKVSHEVRTPMTSIRSFSEILLGDDDPGPATRRRFLRIIHDESLRLTRLLDGILDIDGAETEEAWDERFDPEAAVDRSMATCEALARFGGAVLRREGGADAVMLVGAQDRLSQVLINLIANAIRHNDKPEPVVVVSSRRDGAAYVIAVDDNGPGVPEIEREAVFAKFRRGRATAPGGAGLGLAISRDIVARFTGTLAVRDGGLGGACFEIRIPLSAAPEAGDAA